MTRRRIGSRLKNAEDVAHNARVTIRDPIIASALIIDKHPELVLITCDPTRPSKQRIAFDGFRTSTGGEIMALRRRSRAARADGNSMEM